MVDDDAVTDMIENMLAQRLRELQTLTGLPIVFGGAVRRTATGRYLEISQLLGNTSDSLHGLRVARGRGLGGTALVKGVPCRVNDYASTGAITHDFDHHVVQQERITSVFALPVKVWGRIGGIMYGAVRDTPPIGDITLRRACSIAATLEREIGGVLGRPAPAPDRPQQNQAALAELAAIARRTTDPALRADLARIHRELTGGADPEPQRLMGEPVKLAPREIEVLRLVAVGSSNLEIAEALGLSQQTVKAYLRSATRRLEVRNRTAAVHAARSLGLL